MDTAKFRKDLVKIMPGYKWTVHRPPPITKGLLQATGIQVSGFNRLSTLSVIWREKDGVVEYEVKSAGYGRRAPWLAARNDKTLARALRRLQDHYETMAGNYQGHASDLEYARAKHHNDDPA